MKSSEYEFSQELSHLQTSLERAQRPSPLSVFSNEESTDMESRTSLIVGSDKVASRHQQRTIRKHIQQIRHSLFQKEKPFTLPAPGTEFLSVYEDPEDTSNELIIFSAPDASYETLKIEVDHDHFWDLHGSFFVDAVTTAEELTDQKLQLQYMDIDKTVQIVFDFHNNYDIYIDFFNQEGIVFPVYMVERNPLPNMSALDATIMTFFLEVYQKQLKKPDNGRVDAEDLHLFRRINPQELQPSEDRLPYSSSDE